jgi:hypothetical protein
VCQSVKDAGVSGRAWEDCVYAGEGVGVGKDVRGCQGDGQGGASLRREGGCIHSLVCAVEGLEAVNVRIFPGDIEDESLP